MSAPTRLSAVIGHVSEHIVDGVGGAQTASYRLVAEGEAGLKVVVTALQPFEAFRPGTIIALLATGKVAEVPEDD